MRSVAAVVALVVCLHATVWALTQEKIAAPDVQGPLASVSYSPFQGHPEEGSKPSPDQIRSDLIKLAPNTGAIRTYSSTGGGELVPPIAADFGLKVSVGAWLDENAKRNFRELRSASDLVRKNRNISAIVVGNETIYRGNTVLLAADRPEDERLIPEELQKLSPDEQQRLDAARGSKDENKIKESINVAHLIKVLQRAKRMTGGRVPVTTGEIWNIWLAHPELVSSVDFIAAHVLPYWEGLTPAQAVDFAINTYDKLRQAYPGKRVVIAEFGWPSGGYNRMAAEPGRIEQATVLRDFAARAEAYGIDYNIIEAYDQPWKSFEGSVGAYWGLFDASRQPKFAWTGPITDSDHWKIASVAIAVSVLLSVPILMMAGAILLLERSLLCPRRGVRAWIGLGAARSPGCDCAVADEGDRRRLVCGIPAAPARLARASTRRFCPKGFDSYSGLPGTARDAEGDARFDCEPGISQLRVHRRHQQHA